MTTINIYDNKNFEEDVSILQKDYKKELDEIKELLRTLHKDNLQLRKLLLEKYVFDIDNKINNIEEDGKGNGESETISDVVEETIKEEDGNVSNVHSKNDKSIVPSKKEIDGLKKELISLLPTFTKEDARLNCKIIQSNYPHLNSHNRKELLKDSYTLTDMVNDLKMGRYDIEKYILKPLLDSGEVKSFKANPKIKKSLKLYYRVGDETSTKIAHFTKRNTVNAPFVLPASVEGKYYHNVSLLPTGEIEHISNNQNHRRFILKYDIYDVMYIKSLSDDKSFTYADFKILCNKNKEWNAMTLHKLIYNIRNNESFNDIINRARSVLTNDMFFSRKDDMLKINDAMTYITVQQAEAWCSAYINGNKSRDVFVWELQRRFPELNKDYIAIIIYNSGNSELLDVLKEDKVKFDFVENNPSKRKNLIMNGGLM